MASCPTVIAKSPDNETARSLEFVTHLVKRGRAVTRTDKRTKAHVDYTRFALLVCIVKDVVDAIEDCRIVTKQHIALIHRHKHDVRTLGKTGIVMSASVVSPCSYACHMSAMPDRRIVNLGCKDSIGRGILSAVFIASRRIAFKVLIPDTTDAQFRLLFIVEIRMSEFKTIVNDSHNDTFTIKSLWQPYAIEHVVGIRCLLGFIHLDCYGRTHLHIIHASEFRDALSLIQG